LLEILHEARGVWNSTGDIYQAIATVVRSGDGARLFDSSNGLVDVSCRVPDSSRLMENFKQRFCERRVGEEPHRIRIDHNRGIIVRDGHALVKNEGIPLAHLYAVIAIDRESAAP